MHKLQLIGVLTLLVSFVATVPRLPGRRGPRPSPTDVLTTLEKAAEVRPNPWPAEVSTRTKVDLPGDLCAILTGEAIAVRSSMVWIRGRPWVAHPLLEHFFTRRQGTRGGGVGRSPF